MRQAWRREFVAIIPCQLALGSIHPFMEGAEGRTPSDHRSVFGPVVPALSEATHHTVLINEQIGLRRDGRMKVSVVSPCLGFVVWAPML